MPKKLTLFVLLFSLPAVAWGQSLADAARKERERREKNKTEGVVTREFSEKEIFGEEDEPVEGEEATEDEAEDEVGEDATPRSRPSLGSDTAANEPDPLEQERSDRQRNEAEWRTRFQTARQRVTTARERVQFLRELNLTPGESYVDAQGNTVIGSLEQLRRLMADAEQQLSDAEQSLSALQEEARRAGVPPGWIR